MNIELKKNLVVFISEYRIQREKNLTQYIIIVLIGFYACLTLLQDYLPYALQSEYKNSEKILIANNYRYLHLLWLPSS